MKCPYKVGDLYQGRKILSITDTANTWDLLLAIRYVADPRDPARPTIVVDVVSIQKQYTIDAIELNWLESISDNSEFKQEE